MRRALTAGALALAGTLTWPHLAEAHLPWAAILLALVVLDMILALAVAIGPQGSGISLDRLISSARKLLAYFGVVTLLYLMGGYREEAWQLLMPTYLYFSATEGISILGHCVELGGPVPDPVRRWFESIRGESANSGA